jgi:hypothetical protein
VCGSSGRVPLLFLAGGQSITTQGQSYGTGSTPGGSPRLAGRTSKGKAPVAAKTKRLTSVTVG